MRFLHKLYKLKQGSFFALPSPSLAEGVWMEEVWHDGCFCVLFDQDGVWRGVVTVGVTQGRVLGPLRFLCSHLICLFPSVAGMLCAILSFVSSSPAVLSLCESLWTWKTLLWRDVSLEKQRRLTCVTHTKPVCCCGLYTELHLLRWITTLQITASDSGLARAYVGTWAAP